MPSTASVGSSALFLGELLSSTEHGTDVADITLPPSLENRIAVEIGALWDVEPENIVLQWGPINDVNQLADDTEFRVVGRGMDGWFAVLFEPEGTPGFAVRLHAGLRVHVAVARHRLEAGHIVTDRDLRLRKQLHWGPPSHQYNLVAGPGWTILDTVRPGDVVAEPVAAPQAVVAAGDHVRLTWRRGVVTVTIEGIALHEAAIGREINVDLRGRRGQAKGIVTGPGAAALQ